MSEVSSRPRVRSVICRSVDVHTIGSVVVGTVVSEALSGLASEAFTTQPSIECSRIDRLIASPEATLRLAEGRIEAASRVAPGTDRLVAEKAAALLAISQAPLVVRPAAVMSHVDRLMEASTIETVREAERDLVHAIKSENAYVLGEALAASCRQASIDTGFVNVETTVGAVGDIRVVATDASGRALVSEIHRGDDTHAPSVETEVVGFTDGRCHASLDRFDASMEAQGVRTEGSPERKWTGGVCELSMARDFIRQKVAPAVRRPETPRSRRSRLAPRVATVKQGGR
jgi:hypothetical protein